MERYLQYGGRISSVWQREIFMKVFRIVKGYLQYVGGISSVGIVNG